jgi:hypothetical protein
VTPRRVQPEHRQIFLGLRAPKNRVTDH